MQSTPITLNWFKTIPVAPDYECNPLGMVRKKSTGQWIADCSRSDGYRMIKLRHNKKRTSYNLHWIVFITWHTSEIPQGYVIDHIDNNKRNNHADNLQMITYKANTKKYYSSRAAQTARQLDNTYTNRIMDIRQ